MIRPLSSVRQKTKDNKKAASMGLVWPNFGSSPRTTPKLKMINQLGPWCTPGLAQRPAPGALPPRATRSIWGGGRASIKAPGTNKKERERKREEAPGPGRLEERNAPAITALADSVRSARMIHPPQPRKDLRGGVRPAMG